MTKAFSISLRAQWWFLGVILFVSVISNFAGIRAIEFTGEDEFMFMTNGLGFLDGLTGNFKRIIEICLFYYPPLQSVIPLPFIAGFGASEWTMRFPNALAGVVICFLLYRIVLRSTSDPRSALLAALLYAVSGVAGNNKFALTGGLLSLGLIIAFDGLSQFLDSKEEKEENLALFWCTFGLVVATMSLQDALFYLPILAIVYWTKRRIKVTQGTIPALAFMIAGIGGYILFWIVLPKIFFPSTSFGALKVEILISQLGAFRIPELIGGYRTATSLPVMWLSLILLPLGFLHGSKLLRWMTLFYGFPLLLWTFVFDYPNLRVSHLLVAFPLFCALWAQGSITIWDWLHHRPDFSPRIATWLWSFLMMWAVASTALQNAFLYGTDRLSQMQASLLGPVTSDYLPQGRRFIRFGQHAAGMWIRANTPQDQEIMSNLGGSFAAYYAQHNAARRQMLITNGTEVARWKAAHIRYLVYSAYFPLPPGSPPLSSYTPAARVVIHGQTALTIYDLWNETAHITELDYESARTDFAQLHTAWRDYLH